MVTRAYIRYECPVCGHHIDIRARNAVITCNHPNRAIQRVALMKPAHLLQEEAV